MIIPSELVPLNYTFYAHGASLYTRRGTDEMNGVCVRVFYHLVFFFFFLNVPHSRTRAATSSCSVVASGTYCFFFFLRHKKHLSPARERACVEYNASISDRTPKIGKVMNRFEYIPPF